MALKFIFSETFAGVRFKVNLDSAVESDFNHTGSQLGPRIGKSSSLELVPDTKDTVWLRPFIPKPPCQKNRKMTSAVSGFGTMRISGDLYEDLHKKKSSWTIEMLALEYEINPFC